MRVVEDEQVRDRVLDRTATNAARRAARNERVLTPRDVDVGVQDLRLAERTADVQLIDWPCPSVRGSEATRANVM